MHTLLNRLTFHNHVVGTSVPVDQSHRITSNVPNVKRVSREMCQMTFAAALDSQVDKCNYLVGSIDNFNSWSNLWDGMLLQNLKLF